MCGRSRCKYTAEEYCSHARVPMTEFPDHKQYNPVENCSPGMELPVIICKNSCNTPSLTTPIECSSNNSNHHMIKLMKWGLIPSYTSVGRTTGTSSGADVAPKFDYYRMFNARSETVFEKPVFSRLVKSSRCISKLNQGQSQGQNLNQNRKSNSSCNSNNYKATTTTTTHKRGVVILSGFYEWKVMAGTKNKQPYYITLVDPTAPTPVVKTEGEKYQSGTADKVPVASPPSLYPNPNPTPTANPATKPVSPTQHPPMRCACIYDVLRVPDPHFPGHFTEHYSFAILTVPSNAAMRCYHDRQPLVLTEAEANIWLDGEGRETETDMQRGTDTVDGADIGECKRGSFMSAAKSRIGIEDLGADVSAVVESKKRKWEKDSNNSSSSSSGVGVGVGAATGNMDAEVLELIARYTQQPQSLSNERVGFQFVPVTPRMNKANYQGDDCSVLDTTLTAVGTSSLMKFFSPTAAATTSTGSPSCAPHAAIGSVDLHHSATSVCASVDNRSSASARSSPSTFASSPVADAASSAPATPVTPRRSEIVETPILTPNPTRTLKPAPGSTPAALLTPPHSHKSARSGPITAAGTAGAGTGAVVARNNSKLWPCFVCGAQISVPMFSDAATEQQFISVHVQTCLAGGSTGSGGGSSGSGGGSSGRSSSNSVGDSKTIYKSVFQSPHKPVPLRNKVVNKTNKGKLAKSTAGGGVGSSLSGSSSRNIGSFFTSNTATTNNTNSSSKASQLKVHGHG